MNTVLGSPKVLADRFPVPVACPPHPGGLRLSRARLILTGPERDAAPRMYVFTSPNEPQIDMPWLPAGSVAGGIHQEWRIATDVGDYVVSPGRGCRCGRLGHATLYHPERRESLTKVLRQAREAAS